MATFTRRDFVRGVAAIPFSLWMMNRLGAAGPRVRYDVRSAKGVEMLKIYAGAVAAMKNLGATDPSNWVFQWYTHFVKSSTDKGAELTRIFGSGSSPHKALATAMWNTCRSHSGQDENLFLPWHRMYVYYFEEIIRAVSKRDDFTLPYWNYSADDATHGKLPPQFLNGSDPTFGALFVKDRNALANSGEPIDKNKPGALNLDALREATYSPSGALQGFCLKLDSVLHGNVHVLTGAGQNMGAVPWAANDPVFWVHHCNIDRLWASWNANGGKNPNESWGNSVFTFADAKGTAVTGKASDFFDIAKLGYSYEKLEPKPKSALRLEAVAAKAKPSLTAKAAKRVELSAAPVVIALDLAKGTEEGAKPATLQETVARLTENQRLYLVLRGLEAQAQPEVLYNVYVGEPGKEASVTDENRVGSFSFFDAQKLDHGDGGGHHEGHGDGDKFYSFDVTAQLKRLGGKKALGDTPSVVIVPDGEPKSEAKPVIGTVELQRQ
ncbi:tyrosinase [Tahibacter aquaticus]|uniref:Tyrosinase n=1 Tax=Tahibacter aquaticus TaxID=520092 RepID=A0A4R6YR80_9GAMM|nr:tyrosinase family protein [Tahibacter aquaticus]TDR40344.1 tyrosinase [Tahibacter aquaticus]